LDFEVGVVGLPLLLLLSAAVVFNELLKDEDSTVVGVMVPDSCDDCFFGVSTKCPGEIGIPYRWLLKV